MQHQLNLKSLRETTIRILKQKGQWNENQTKVTVESHDMKSCLVFVIEINRISSTMMLSQNWPKQLISNSKKPIIMAFRADQQHAGRGQKQNTWESPQGNLYLTLLTKIQFTHFPYLPIIAISNVFKTVKYFLDESECKKITMIKWINDVMIDFEKVSGVLIKNQMVGLSLFTQIGIGINIKKSPLNIQSFTQTATNLQEQTEKNIQIKEVCIKLLQSFVQSFFSQDFNKTTTQSKKIYEENLAYLNRDVIIYDFRYEKVLGTGVFKGINQFGHAIIEGYEKPFVEGRMKAHHLAL